MKEDFLEELLISARNLSWDLEKKFPDLENSFEIRIRPNNGILKEYNGEADIQLEFSSVDEIDFKISLGDLLDIGIALNRYLQSF